MTKKEEGCINYELYQDEQNSTILTMIEEWDNKQSLDMHFKSEHFTKIVPILGKLMSKKQR